MKLKLCTALLTAATLLAPLSMIAEKAQNSAEAKRAAARVYSNLPLSFEPTESSARFLAHSGGYAVSVGVRESVITVPDAKSGKAQTLRFAFDRANAAAPLEAIEPQPGVTNYYLGQDAGKWRLGVKNYAKLRARGIYPGVDVVYYGDHRRLEFDFVVAPKADSRAISLSFSGMEKLYKDASGDLVAELKGQPVRFAKPYAYQRVAGVSKPVEVDYELAGSKAHLRVGAYDTNSELIIDPVVSYATYLGGGSTDVGNGIAVDSDGSAYVTGQTCSPTSFPDTANVSGLAFNGSCDAYVVKYSVDGSTYQYTTILGGASPNPSNGTASGNGIALDSSKQAYIIGTTNFRDLPGNIGGYRNSWQGGDSDAFIAVLAANGGLVHTSYLGGSGADAGYGIAVDTSNSVTAAGQTCSDDFPAYNAIETKVEFCVAFITKLDSGLHIAPPLGNGVSALSPPPPPPPGTTYYFSGFFAGQPVPPAVTDVWTTVRYYYPGAIVYDNATPSNVQITYTGGTSGAVPPVWKSSKLDLTYDGTITWENLGATAIPPYATTEAYGVALDPLGDVFTAGGTNTADLASNAPFLYSYYHGTGAWVLKLNGQNGAFVYGTALETNASDKSATINAARAIAVDTSGRAYVTGTATGSIFTTPASYKPGITGGEDAFLVRMDIGGGKIEYGTYLGGTGNDQGLGVAVDTSGAAYITGSTQSTDFPTVNPLTNPNSTPVANAPLTMLSGGQDAFISKLAADGSALIFSAYLGGSGFDQGNAIATDAHNAGNMYVAGNTSSADLEQLDPAAYTAPQTNYGGSGDAFLAMVAGADLPTVTVTPGNLSFGTLSVGSTSAPVAIQYLNTNSNSTVNISSITFGTPGTAGSDFTQVFPGTSPEDCVPGAIKPSTACNIWVVFSPSAANLRNATLTITDDASTTPHLVTLAGTGSVPKASISPTSLTFASQIVGTTSTAQLVTLRNTGGGSLSISSIAITGTNSGDFSQTNNCGSQVAPASSCVINVTFNPSGSGARNGVLTVTDNAPGSPHTVALSGTGGATSSGTISLSPTSLAFGNQQVGTTSVTQTVTVNNSSSSALAISSINVSGANASAFAQTNTCSASLAANTSCSIKVTFAPSAVGAETATLIVNSAQSVTLTGTGIAAPSGSSGNFTITPAATGVSVIQGATAVFTFSVTPNAGAKDAIAFTCSGPVGSSCSVSPASLTLDGVTSPTVKLSVGTTGGNGTSAKLAPAGLAKSIFLAVLPFSMMGMLLISKRRGVLLALALTLLCLALGSASCGGSGSSGSSAASSQLAPGSYQEIFTATSGGTAQSVTLTLVVNKQ
jgi:hypothetical protein